MKIAHVSTFPELKCGIAIYAADLVNAFSDAQNVKYALHYGTNFSADVAGHANVTQKSEMESLARSISASDCDVVSLQHEFGIWGEMNLAYFLQSLNKPIVTTIHTTEEHGGPSRSEVEILGELVRRSARVVVLSKLSKQTFLRVYQCDPDKVAVIPHGIPDIPYSAPPAEWCSNPEREVCNFVSLGFFNAAKGFETTLAALARIKKKGMRFSYVIAGGQQPQFGAQSAYRDRISRLIQELDLSDCVHIHDQFLSRQDQINLIQAAHAGIFAYQYVGQASSGVVPLVLGAGRPAICTSFEYARAKCREPVYIVLADGFGVDAVERALHRFWNQAASLVPTTKQIYDYTRAWVWSEVAREYGHQFRVALASG